MPWFQRRRAAAEQEQHRLWRQARMRTDIQQLTAKMSELESVDTFNAVERHLIQEIQVNWILVQDSMSIFIFIFILF